MPDGVSFMSVIQGKERVVPVRVLALGLVALILAGCGDLNDRPESAGTSGTRPPLPALTTVGAPPSAYLDTPAVDPEWLDSCTYVVEPGAILDPAPLWYPLLTAQVWFETSGSDLLASIERAAVTEGERPYLELGEHAALVDRASVIADRREDGFEIHTLRLRPEAASAIRRLGDRPVLLSATRPPDKPRVGLVIWVEDDGAIGATGTCDDHAIVNLLNEYAGSHAPMPPWDVVLELVADPEVGDTISEWLYPEPTRWEDLDPAERQVDPEETPEDILEALIWLNIRLSIPDDWHGPYTLCTRTAIGWGECVGLDSDAEVRNPDLFAYPTKGATVELWILGPDADLSAPLLFLGKFEYDGRSGGLALRIVPPPGPSLDDLVAQAVPLDTVAVVG